MTVTCSCIYVCIVPTVANSKLYDENIIMLNNVTKGSDNPPKSPTNVLKSQISYLHFILYFREGYSMKYVR